MRVAVGRLHFEDAITDLQDRNVEGAAAEVVNGNRAGFLFLVEAVSECGGCRLVNDAQHFEASDFASIFGGLTLSIIEVRGNCDDRLRDLLAKFGFSAFFHFLQNESRDLLRGILLTVALNPGVAGRALNDFKRRQLQVLLDIWIIEAAANQSFDGIERVGRVGDTLAFRGQADQTFIVGGKRHDRWSRVGALGVFKHLRLTALHDRDARVRRAEVDTNNLTHSVKSFFKLRQTGRSHFWRSAGITMMWS